MKGDGEAKKDLQRLTEAQDRAVVLHESHVRVDMRPPRGARPVSVVVHPAQRGHPELNHRVHDSDAERCAGVEEGQLRRWVEGPEPVCNSDALCCNFNNSL